MATDSPVHMNHHLLCAIDVETTGDIPGYHEIIQIAIIPLNTTYEPSKKYTLFDQHIRPMHLDRVDYNAMNVNKATLKEICEKGHDKEVIYDLFDHWFNALNLGEKKRIIPLAHNWLFDASFIADFFGVQLMRDYFHGHYRDLQCAACFMNDRSDVHAEQTPFNDLKLRQIANKLGLDPDEGVLHNALYDALLTSQCYRKLLYDWMPGV